MKKILTGQSGIAQILILLFMVSAIGLGTYLIEQRTNLLPKAAGRTVACDGQSLSGQSDQSKNDFTNKYKERAAEAWVEEHELDLIKIGTPCGKDSTGSSPVPGSSSGSQGGTNNSGSQIACKEDFTPTYFDAKILNRYARYLALTRGIPGYCVQADLGAKDPGLREDSAEGNVKNGRLYLCSGAAKADGSNPDLLWRVVSDNGQDIETSNRGTEPLSLDQINKVMGEYVDAAKSKVH